MSREQLAYLECFSFAGVDTVEIEAEIERVGFQVLQVSTLRYSLVVVVELLKSLEFLVQDCRLTFGDYVEHLLGGNGAMQFEYMNWDVEVKRNEFDVGNCHPEFLGAKLEGSQIEVVIFPERELSVHHTGKGLNEVEGHLERVALCQLRAHPNGEEELLHA